jgi:hypothetical protein
MLESPVRAEHHCTKKRSFPITKAFVALTEKFPWKSSKEKYELAQKDVRIRLSGGSFQPMDGPGNSQTVNAGLRIK